MDYRQIASLKLSVDPDALREIISSGRLLEFANTASAEAALQINTQLVQQVAEAAISEAPLTGGATVEALFVLNLADGSYGTPVPRWPRPVEPPEVVVVIVDPTPDPILKD